MNVLFYLNTLFIIAIIFFTTFIFIDKGTKHFIERNRLVFIIIFALAIIYKLPFDFSFFQGLEYEDSYLANSVSRYLMHNRDNTEPFLATTCSVGAIDNCTFSSTHSGNLNGLPIILSTLNEIIGYNVKTVSIINLMFSIISAISIFLICYKLNKSHIFGLIASIVFITCPILNSFHTSSLFETSSSSLIVISLFLFILYFENKLSNRNGFILFMVMIVVNLISIHFKRENIIVLSFPFVFLFIRLIDNRKTVKIKKKGVLLYSVFLLGLVFYYFYVLNISDSLEIEREYAIGNSFQLKFFIPLFKMFLKGFSNFQWFYFYSIFCIIGILLIIFDAKNNPLLLYPLIIFFVFIVINSIHHRSYYFVRSGEVSAFDSLRHINMLSPFFSIVSGYGIFRLFEFLSCKIVRKNKLRAYVYPIIALILIHLLILGYSTRNELIAIEKHNRIEPVSVLLESVDQEKDVVITDQSILLHNYCQESLTIIELTALGEYVSEDEVNDLLKKSNIYFLWKGYFNESVFRERYKNSIDIVERFKLTEVAEGDGYEVLKLVSN